MRAIQSSKDSHSFSCVRHRRPRFLSHIIHATIADWQRGSRMTFMLPKQNTKKPLSLLFSLLSLTGRSGVHVRDAYAPAPSFPLSFVRSFALSGSLALTLTHRGRVVSAGVRSYGGTGPAVVRALGGRYGHASPSAHRLRRTAYDVPGSVIEFSYTPIDDLITELDFPIGTRKQRVAQPSTGEWYGKNRSVGPRLWPRRGKSGHHASGRVHQRWTSVPVPPGPESGPPRTRPEPVKMGSPEGRHALRVLFRARRRGHHTRVR